MKKSILISFFLLLIVLSSCDPCKRISKPKYKPCFTIEKPDVKTPEIKDSFRIILLVNDTTVIHYVDSLLINDTCLSVERKQEIAKSIQENIPRLLETMDTTITNADYSLNIKLQDGKFTHSLVIHPQDCDCPPQKIYKERPNYFLIFFLLLLLLVAVWFLKKM